MTTTKNSISHNWLSAGLAGISELEYTQKMDALIGKMDIFRSVPANLKDEEEYGHASAIKSALCALSCFTFNNKHPLNDEVWGLEGRWGKIMHAYNRRLLLKDPLDHAIARYLASGRRYNQYAWDTPALYERAREKGYLHRTQGGGVALTGIEVKLGDNVFTTDRRGRHHRQYRGTIGRQAFGLDTKRDCIKQEFIDTLPLLPESYYHVSFADHKNCARSPALRRTELDRVWAFLEQSHKERVRTAPLENAA
jgi:hypothetical protein